MPHCIRLRGPWDYQPLVRFLPESGGRSQPTTDRLPPGGTIHLPADWGDVLGVDFRGTVEFTRTFHKPTGLSPTSHVWLLVDEVDWHAVVTLNGRLLGELVASGESAAEGNYCPARFDITADLLPLNRLAIKVTAPRLCEGVPIDRPGREGQPGGLIGLVRLEIE